MRKRSAPREKLAQFDNLRGTGQPFAYADDERQPDWLGLHVLRENGFLPEWLELRKQIAAERDDVAATLDAWRDEIAVTGSPSHPLAHTRGRALSSLRPSDQRQDRPAQPALSIIAFRDRAIPRGCATR